MADITFEISKREGKKALGRLKWPAKSLDAPAISGPYGGGALPNGIYDAFRKYLLDKPAGSPYCDSSGNCWMQRLDATFPTTHTDLGVHPDGGVVGTEGCIGISDKNTKPWYDALYAVANKVTVEVKDA